MFDNLKDFETVIKDKNVIVVGIGVSNAPLIKMLVKLGAFVTACDKKEDIGELAVELKELGVTLKLGDNYLSNLEGDYLFKTPGMRFDVPELIAFKEKGGKVTSEMEVFFDVCPAKIIAVTGSDGKTTTTTLIYEMLKDAGFKVHLGGNIGKPLLADVYNINKEDYVVLELSSFQLHTMTKSPHIGVVTNVSPNHLDMHKSMEEYIDAKANVFKYQSKDDFLVLNFSNEITKNFKSESKITYFSIDTRLQNGVYFENGFIYNNDKKLIDIHEIKLPGMHNVDNFMAAYAAVKDIVELKSFLNVARNFGEIKHRIEFVREINNIKFYNDSIASSPTRAMALLNAFYEQNKKVIMIAGGYDKKLPFDKLGVEIAKKVKKLYLVGATAPKIKKAVMDCDEKFPIFVFDDLLTATNEAFNNAESGDVIALCPACASFDLYKNFEERGNLFKEIVNKIEVH